MSLTEQELGRYPVSFEYDGPQGRYTITGEIEATLWVKTEDQPPYYFHEQIYHPPRITAGINGQFVPSEKGALYTVTTREKIEVRKEATIALDDDYTFKDINIARVRVGAPEETRFNLYAGGMYDNGGPRVTFKWVEEV